MNGINRRGQKVRCLFTFDITDIYGVRYGGGAPVEGETYTVANFMDNGRMMIMADQHDRIMPGDHSPAIELYEVPSLIHPNGKTCGWPIMAFRPVVDTPSAEAERLLRLITDAPPLEVCEEALQGAIDAGAYR